MAEQVNKGAGQITTTRDGLQFRVRVVPRAGRDAIAGVIGDALKIRVAAPPEGGRANDAVISLLADWLGVKRGRIEIVAGIANRDKIVRVTGIAVESLTKKLEAARGR